MCTMLAGTLGALALVTGCGSTPEPKPTPSAATPLSGVYRWTLTKDDARRYGSVRDKTPDGLAGYPNTITMTLKDGRWTFEELTDLADGTYTVTGDRVAFTWPRETLVLTFSYTADPNGDLHLKSVPPMDVGDRFVWSTRPWTKIG